jgi:hypothetical protein
MASIKDLDQIRLLEIERQFQRRAESAAVFEDAAQQYVEVLYEALNESLVLARVFATLPFEKLPSTNQQAVTALAESAGVGRLIRGDTPVLSLMGTRGQRSEWNHRRHSKGHIGIPLVSADVIDAIPMMSRLLKQMGLDLDWIDKHDAALIANAANARSGLFYVRNACSEVDTRGRKIIAAQDFVEQYEVRTVFGLGGNFAGTPTFMTSIFFTREEVEREQAEAFEIHVRRIKASTLRLVNAGKMFADRRRLG